MEKRSRNIVLFILTCIIYSPVFSQTIGNGTFLTAGNLDTDPVSSSDEKHPPYLLKRGDNELGFWAGYSPKAITSFGGLYDDEAEGRQFFIASFRYGRTLAANDFLALQYALDASPLIVATGVIVDRTKDADTTVFQRETAYGIGVNPAGLQLDFANGSKIHPFIYANGGVSLFNKSMPMESMGRVAFIGHGGGGVRIFTSDRRALTLGFIIHHISNAGLQNTNCGLNQYIFYAGFSFFK